MRGSLLCNGYLDIFLNGEETQMRLARNLSKKSVSSIKLIILFPMLLVSLLFLSTLRAEQPDERPNILLIMSDDMGISDLGCYGGEINTPHLDTLASQGVRVRAFYNCGRCCPTRASLLTGLYPHQTGIGYMMGDSHLPGYRGNLNKKCVTIAEVLRPAGYKTYMVGKWHLTNRDTDYSDISNWPVQRGFDECYTTLFGAGNYFQPAGLIRGNRFISSENDSEYKPQSGTYYFTQACSDNAVKFLQNHAQENKESGNRQPFFMYLAYTAAHWPMQALPEDIARYKGKFDAGWDVLRVQRLERMKRLGVVDASTELSPRDNDAPAWDSLSEQDKRWFASRMEVYAAMVDRMDQGIGQIINQLKSSGQFENTLILFLEDNGACAEELKGGKKILYAKGKANAQSRRKPMSPSEPSISRNDEWTREGFPIKSGRVTPGPADTYISYGLPWANLSDTPFRMYKHFVHEGGISTPLIVSWPNKLPGRDWVSGPGHIVDIMPTCIEAANAQYPQKRGDEDVTPCQGISLIPALSGEQIDRPAPLFWEHENNRALREGKWKLVSKGKKGVWELYDIDVDRTELHDLASKYPELVKQLSEKWEQWAARTNVYPKPEK